MDSKISQLGLVITLDDTDVIPIVNGSETKKVSLDSLKTYIGSGISTNAVMKITVKLATSINKGQAVYVSSATGTNIVVSKASNTSEATSSKTIGLLETTGATNAILNVVTDGLLTGLNTSTAIVGDPVWLGVNGDLIYGLVNKPFTPAHLVYIGVVTRVHAVNGEILIKVQNGFELKEIHDVAIVNPLNENIIQYDSITSLWKNISPRTVTNLGNSDYTALSTDKDIITNVILTAPRNVTLPLANSVYAGYEIIIADFIGTVTNVNTLTISKSNTDTINGINTVIIGASYGMRRLISDGISKWSYDGGVMRISDYNFKNNQPITADINGKLTSTTTDLVNRRNGYTLSDDFTNLATNGIWIRTAISVGTTVAQPLLLDENHIGIVSFSSAVSANSGYYIISYNSTISNLSKLIPNLQTDLIFKLPITVNSLTTIRFGLTTGSITSADAVSGAYFEINGNSLVGKTANSSVRSSTSATTLIADVWYHLRVTVVSASLIKYDVYFMDGTLFSTQTLNTNIPTVALNSILIATCSDVVVTQLAIVDYIGITFPPMIRGALN